MELISKVMNSDNYMYLNLHLDDQMSGWFRQCTMRSVICTHKSCLIQYVLHTIFQKQCFTNWWMRNQCLQITSSVCETSQFMVLIMTTLWLTILMNSTV